MFLTILKVSHSWRKLKSLHFIQILLTFHILYTIIYTFSTVVIRRASNLSTVWTQSLWFYMTHCTKWTTHVFLFHWWGKTPLLHEKTVLQNTWNPVIFRLSHVRPMFPLYTPWKRRKNSGFLLFSGGIEREYWPEIGYHNFTCHASLRNLTLEKPS